ncbi:NAD-dependent malic enzyme [candidate division WOR-3 bacterium]|nr:NAD-dependent malic enzyme [candidate division WOR-3 bacterium]
MKYADKIVKTLRIKIKDVPGKFGELAMAIGKEGGLLGDIIKVRLDSHYVIRDVTIYIDDDEHLDKVLSRLKKIDGVKLIEITDEVLKLHEGGKITMKSKIALNTISDLQKIYTPGVASVCHAILRNPKEKYRYTSISNTVAIITNGTAILGLGNIGPVAGMPVMEGKAVLFDKLVGISGIPILIDAIDTEEIVHTIARISDTFGAIILEDIAAPSCFEVEKKLQELVDIPVLHDDQHGTAIVVLSALMNALRLVRKKKENIKVVISGAGAAGIAIAKILLAWKVRDVILCDRKGAIYSGRKEGMNEYKEKISKLTNNRKEKGSLSDIIRQKDIFIGVSVPNLLTSRMVRTMSKSAVIFALANPIPEIWPHKALKAGAALAFDGRSINNALAFPGIFRGALDARAKRITDKMKITAARSLAESAKEEEIVPHILDLNVHKKVAEAVRKAVEDNDKF